MADFATEQTQALEAKLGEAEGKLQRSLERLYSQERNIELSCFWDAGWRVRLGDVTNGFTTDDWFDSLDDVADYIDALVTALDTITDGQGEK